MIDRKMCFLYYQTQMLRIVGYTLQPDESRMLRGYAIGLGILLGVVMLPELHFVLANANDVMLATNAVCPLITSILSLIRVVQLNRCLDRYYALWKRLQESWQKGMQLASDRPILYASYQTSHNVFLFYAITSTMVVILYVSAPLVSAGYDYLQTGSCEWIFPFDVIFLYDITKPLNYILTYLCYATATFSVLFGTVPIDSVFYAATFFLAGHCTVIRRHLRMRINGKSNSSAEAKRLRKLIEYHQDVLEVAEEVIGLYRPILLSFFLLASLQVCVVTYQLTLDYPVAKKVHFTSYLSAILFQLLVFCNGGAQLEEMSQTIADAIYSYPWYTANREVRKLILFFMMRTQKPIVTQAVIFRANLELFLSILSSAGSYITLLQTMSEEK